MIISTEHIKSMNPCADRLDNYLKYHKDFSGTVHEFLSLENITHGDKLWVTLRVLDKKQSIECICRFTELGLDTFSNKYPADLHIREVIEAARKGKNLKEVYVIAANAYAYASAAVYACATDLTKSSLQKRQIQIIIDAIEGK